MPDRIVISKYNKQPMVIFIKDDTAVKIRCLNNINDYTGQVFLGRVKTVKNNINSSFVKYNNEIGYLGSAQRKPETVFPVMLKKETPLNKENELTDVISITGIYTIVSSSICGTRFSKKSNNNIKCNEKLREFDNALIRTNANNVELESVINEYNLLKTTFDNIYSRIPYIKENNILYQGIPLVISYIFSEDLSNYDEILVDDNEIYEIINNFFVDYKDNGIEIPIDLRLYKDDLVPLNAMISLSSKIDRAINKKVFLKSDAYLVFDYTEAMTIIDVNSGTTTFKGDKASVIHKINIEACDEIALQLKLRNLSGMILVDFINEQTEEYKEELIHKLKTIFHDDDAHAKFIDLTKLGIAEITRNRTDKPLREQLWK